MPSLYLIAHEDESLIKTGYMIPMILMLTITPRSSISAGKLCELYCVG